jgi:endonuclease/exonuclease/phosphatase family metal-dependent hydrolase
MSRNTLRIASYNIRKARGLDQKRSPERIVEVLNSLNADIVALQEADRRFGDRVAALPRVMIEQETDFDLVEVGGNAASLGWHGNAVLTRKGVRPVRSERIELPGLEPRGALRIDFDGPTQFSVFAVHLGLMRAHRRAQLRAVSQAAHPAIPTVIAGDFNEWSPSRGLEPLADRFVTHAPGSSFHARRPIAALDRISLSPELRLTDAGVVQNPQARRASDHLPIWADLEFAAPVNAQA